MALSEIRCQHKGCIVRDTTLVNPQWTKRIRDMNHGESQPHWYCGEHSHKHPNVSPLTGAKRTVQYKAYNKRDNGTYVGLVRRRREVTDGDEAKAS
jgi:hypothetical protein